MRQSRSPVPPQVQSTLAKLSLCRTAALGGHRYACTHCEHECTVYNSCGDRHCPQCAGAKRADWLASTAQLLLPGLDYFQVVFTIPDKLSSLALGNRREIYDLLFRSAWRALREVITHEQQFEPAAVMMLHTWNQQLDAHAHVHALVPGGGPSLQQPGEWQRAQPPAHHPPRRRWLVDADTLRRTFRKRFLRGLRRLHQQKKLRLSGAWSSLQNTAAFEAWLRPLEQISWVTYIEPPPAHSTAEHVLKYLARYMTGGPISDHRLVAHADGRVTFRARRGTTPGGNDDTEEVSLPGAEFVRRWSLHILPKGYTKTRRCGGYSNHHRQRYMHACRQLLSKDEPAPDESSLDESSLAAPPPTDHARDAAERECPHCGHPLLCIAASDRPSWYSVMSSPDRPGWYDDG